MRGADAILACPGPSLQEAAGPLAKRPPGCVLFAINTAYPTVRPDVWIGNDSPECYDAALWREPFGKFTGNACAELSWQGRRVKEFPNAHFLDKDKRDDGEKRIDIPTNAFVPKRLGDLPEFVWHWTLFTALHVIAWMGCRRIYLVGVDLNVETPGERAGVTDAVWVPPGKDAAAGYQDGRQLNNRFAQINRGGMAIQLQWLPKIRDMAWKYGYELIVTGENSAARQHLPFVPLAEALERIARRSAPPPHQRVHAVLANQGSWEPETKIREPFGVMTGCDKVTEEALPWWINRLRKWYDGPVAFADFAMSKRAVALCERHGRVISLKGTYLKGWYNKPVALLRSGFGRCVWIDTDAEVCGPLDALQTVDTGPGGLAAALDGLNPMDVGLRPVNTGVVVVDHGSPAVQAWARRVLECPELCRGDQEHLNRLLDDLSAKQHAEHPAELSADYNWLRWRGPPPASAKIAHWTGDGGKQWIRYTSVTLQGRGGEIVRRLAGMTNGDPNRPLHGAEIGVLDGRTSRLLLQEFPGLRLTMVDSWGEFADLSKAGLAGNHEAAVQEQRRRWAMLATEFAADRRTVLRGDSTAMAAKLSDESLDFAFVDAGHTYEACIADVRAWAPKVRPGGLLCGHDIDQAAFPHWGVRKAVEEFLAENAETEIWGGVALELGKDFTWFLRAKESTNSTNYTEKEERQEKIEGREREQRQEKTESTDSTDKEKPQDTAEVVAAAANMANARKYLRWAKPLIDEALRYPWRSLIDLGCGCGLQSRALLAAGGRRVLGIDRIATWEGPTPENLRFVKGDWTDPPGGFDAAYSHHVLEHQRDPIGTLNQWANLVRPGGRLFLAVPPPRADHTSAGHIALGWTLAQLAYLLAVAGWDCRRGRFLKTRHCCFAIVTRGETAEIADTLVDGWGDARARMPESMRIEGNQAYADADDINWKTESTDYTNYTEREQRQEKTEGTGREQEQDTTERPSWAGSPRAAGTDAGRPGVPLGGVQAAASD